MYLKPFIKKNKDFPFIVLGHLSFFLMFLIASVFYKERILFSDSAFQFFKIINFEKINVEAFRYGAILPEIPVLLAMKFGISLNHLTIIYSVSFILLYYLVFICCIHWFKNMPAGLSVIVVLTLCICQSFFHPVTETHQSLVYSVFLYAILQHSGYRYTLIQYLLAAAVIATSFLAHPVALYTNVFVIGYTSIGNKQLKSAKPYLLLILVGSIAITKVMLTSENSYEGKFFSEVLNSSTIVLNLPKVYSTKFFIERLNSLYFWLVILELILIANLIHRKKFTILIWQLGTLIFFMTITLIIYNKGDATMLMERAFMPLAFFVSIPFLKETTENNKQYMVYKFVLLTTVIIISINRIYHQGEKFRERTEFNKELLLKTAQFPNKKFIVEASSLQKNFYTFWSSSFESLILSAITEGIPTQTIYPANDINKLTKYTKDATDVFLGADFWLEWGIEGLNHKYFNLPTDLPYKVINIEKL